MLQASNIRAPNDMNIGNAPTDISHLISNLKDAQGYLDGTATLWIAFCLAILFFALAALYYLAGFTVPLIF